jgi:hypothetical protein
MLVSIPNTDGMTVQAQDNNFSANIGVKIDFNAVNLQNDNDGSIR